MWKKTDRAGVLLDLSESLDCRETLSRFTGLTEDGLSGLLKEAADMMTSPGGEVVVMVDGAARGNPGPAGAGLLVKGPGRTTVRRGEYLGEVTNNVAEYRALILGLEAAVEMGAGAARVFSDSELIVKQMTGEYRVKSPQLRELFILAQKRAEGLQSVSYTYIPRDENREADRLANMAIDAKGKVSL